MRNLNSFINSEASFVYQMLEDAISYISIGNYVNNTNIVFDGNTLSFFLKKETRCCGQKTDFLNIRLLRESPNYFKFYLSEDSRFKWTPKLLSQSEIDNEYFQLELVIEREEG